VFSKAKPRKQAPRFALHLPVDQGKILAIVVVAALVIGLGATQFLHGHMTDMQARVEQVRAKNTAIANENVRLLAARAQVASKTQVTALAKTKLKLFEPDQAQVRRM
jgi:uncharacterized protein HemX